MSTAEIPNPALWAITKRNGAQLIEPGTELHEAIVSNIEGVVPHGIVGQGDILLTGEQSAVINPEDVGVDRKIILKYKTPADVVARRGLGRAIKNH